MRYCTITSREQVHYVLVSDMIGCSSNGVLIKEVKREDLHCVERQRKVEVPFFMSSILIYSES